MLPAAVSGRTRERPTVFSTVTYLVVCVDEFNRLYQERKGERSLSKSTGWIGLSVGQLQ